MEYAKNILDNSNLMPEQGWEYPWGYYNKDDLAIILRDHNPNGIDDLGEVAIRHSFDALLDFFCKLEYLLNINLVKLEEIEYFRYYVDIAAHEAPIVKYVERYNFPLHFKRLSPDVTVHYPDIKPKHDTIMFAKIQDRYLHEMSKNKHPKPYMVGYNLDLSLDQTIDIIKCLEKNGFVKQLPPLLTVGDYSTLELTDSGKEFVARLESAGMSSENSAKKI